MKYIIYVVMFGIGFATSAQWTQSTGKLETTKRLGIGTSNVPANSFLNVSGGGIALNRRKIIDEEISTSSTVPSKLLFGDLDESMEDRCVGLYAHGLQLVHLGSVNRSVGIATSTPNPRAMLDVFGAIAVKGEIFASYETDDNIETILIGDVGIRSEDTNLNNTSLGFYTNDQSRLHINEAGNVGINTVTPDEMLTVVGKIRTAEAKVVVESGADFVFDDDYKLPDLATVKDFIQKHRHLPGIPSAIDMKTEGLALSKMNIDLLQKIEELTLYTLQQESGIQQLRAELIKIKQSNQ